MNKDDRRFKFRVCFQRRVVWIPLTQGKVAVIDIRDSEQVLRYRWRAAKTGYVWYAEAHAPNKDGKQRTFRMHQLIMGQPPVGHEVDHIDSNGLNNRRSNLRWATRRQNCQHARPRSNAKSKLKGAQWHSRRSKRWTSQIKHNGRVRSIWDTFRPKKKPPPHMLQPPLKPLVSSLAIH